MPRRRGIFTRLGRVGFLLGAGVSLLPCVAAAGLWVRSYFALDVVARYTRGGHHAALSSRGVFAVAAQTSYREPGAGVAWEVMRQEPLDLADAARQIDPADRGPVAGFFFGRWDAPRSPRWVVTAPAWFVVLATAVLPPLAARSVVRRRRLARRLAAGCCPACGYDCRATPERCSECGLALAGGGIGDVPFH